MSEPVAIFTSRMEAELARARLDLEGIPSIILADDAGGWEPQLDIHGVRLVVADKDRAPALELLNLPDHVPDAPTPNPGADRWYRLSAWVIIAVLVFGAIQVLRVVF